MTKPVIAKSRPSLPPLPQSLNPSAILPLFDTQTTRGKLGSLIQSRFGVGEHKAAALIKSAITLHLIKPAYRSAKAPLLKHAVM